MEREEWELFDSLQFIGKLSSALEIDTPLNLNLRHIFATILGKFMFQTGCDAGIHLFYNYYESLDNEEKICEIHHLYIDKKKEGGEYLVNAMKERQIDGKILSVPPPYIDLKVSKLEAIGFHQTLKNWLKSKIVIIQKKNDVKDILNAFNKCRRMSRKKEKLSAISCQSDEIMIIPFNLTEFNLGLFMLWGNTESKRTSRTKSIEEINYISKTFQQFSARLIKNHYHANKDTYLPTFQKEGPNDVVILFADIRGFTAVTEIARDRGFSYDLMRFMSNHFKSMTNAIEEFSGRVEKMAGDSIMGIFGEYDKVPQKAVKNAVSTAYKMYIQFQELKSKFLEEQKIKDFFNKYNEPLEFDLGIGINYGEVLFGYFGKPGSRQYMGLGDHANFAQRLEYSASRFDSNEKRKRAPILLSRTAYNLIKDLIENTANPNVLMLALRGKSYEYPVYEFTPEIAKMITDNQ